MKENQNVEWKQSWRDEHLKWICGFANAEGGTLMIGKNDRGEVVGIANAAKLLEDIPNKVRGIALIRNTCTAQGSLAAHFECESTGFGIEFPLPDIAPAKVVGSKGVELDGISKTSVKTSVEISVKTPVEILRCLGANPSMTLEDVATKIEKSLSAVERASAKLVKDGKLRYVGPQKGGHWEVLP